MIFLDIDGVLNCAETAQRHRGVIGIDPYLVAIFNRIIFATEAKIVISSSWRHSSKGLEEIERQVMEYYGITPSLPNKTGNQVDCDGCSAQGYTTTADHDLPGNHGGDGECVSCPVQVQIPCDQCGGAGNYYVPDEPPTTRGREIAKWLSEHLEVTKYAILDDGSDFLPEQKPVHFKTTWEKGLTEEIAQEVIKYLK